MLNKDFSTLNSTYNKSHHLIRWYRMGDGGDNFPTSITDQVSGVASTTIYNMDASNISLDVPK